MKSLQMPQILNTLKNAEDFEANVPGLQEITSLGTCSSSEEDSWPQEPLHIPLIGECFNSERRLRTLAHLENIYSILLHCPPRKPVLVGPNYQADIPDSWSFQDDSCTSSDTGATVHESQLNADNCDQWGGNSCTSLLFCFPME